MFRPDQALPALIPLLTSVVQNLAQLGLPGALTGPVERGDVSSVERHLKTLEARAPELLALYRLVGRDVLRLAREKTKLDPAQRGAPGRAVLATGPGTAPAPTARTRSRTRKAPTLPNSGVLTGRIWPIIGPFR